MAKIPTNLSLDPEVRQILAGLAEEAKMSWTGYITWLIMREHEKTKRKRRSEKN